MQTNTAVYESDTPKRQAKPRPEPEMVSVPDAAARFGVGRSTIFRELAAGRLPRHKLGRKTLVPVAALRALLAPKDAPA